MHLKRFLIWILTAIIITSCGGRTAAPVVINQPNDENKNCQEIELEMTIIEKKIMRLIPMQAKKTKKNIALGVTGYLCIVPLFFMDLSDAEQIELDAFKKRYNHLLAIGLNKKCKAQRIALPDSSTPPPPVSYDR